MSCPVCSDSIFKFKLIDKKVVILNEELYSCSEEHIQCKNCYRDYGHLCKICLNDTFPLGFRVKDVVQWDENEIKDKIQKTKSMNEREIPFTRTNGDADFRFIKLGSDKKKWLKICGKCNQDVSSSEDGVSEICFHTSKDDKEIAGLQKHYSSMCGKLRMIVKRFKRRLKPLPPNTLRIPKTLMPCPDDFCKHIGDIHLFNEHLHKCHKMLPKLKISPKQPANFILDPGTIKHNIVRAFMLYEVTGIMEESKTNQYQGMLPILLLGTRIKLTDLGDNNILLWLAGPVFHSFPLTAQLRVFREDKLPIEKVTTCYLRSLYESPNPIHILQSGCALLLTERDGRKYTRHNKEFINVSIEVHW